MMSGPWLYEKCVIIMFGSSTPVFVGNVTIAGLDTSTIIHGFGTISGSVFLIHVMTVNIRHR